MARKPNNMKNASNPIFADASQEVYNVTTEYPLPVALYAANDGDIASAGVAGSSSNPIVQVDANPLDTKNVALLQVTETGEASGVTTNRYVDVRNYSKVKVQFEKTGGAGTQTHTILASAQDDGTAPSSALYQDISQYGISPLTATAGSASYTTDVLYEVDVKGLSYLNLKTVSSVGTVDYGIYVRSAY